jgi:hypothetical protein
MDDKCDPTRYGKMSDVDLIKGMGTEKECTAVERLCLAEFHCRYSRGVYAYCVKRYSSLIKGKSEALAFVDEVFLDFRKGSTRFNPALAKTPDDIPKLIRCWLKKRADWLASKQLVVEENVAASRIDLDPAKLRFREAGGRRSPQFVAALRRMRLLLHRMPEKAQDVLLTSFSYRDFESGVFLLPQQVQDELCKKWSIPSPNALSQYRLRQIKLLMHEMTQSLVA